MESSHDSAPKSSSPPKKRSRVLCNRCSGIVTSESSKYNNLQASVTTAVWQASYFPSQSDLDGIKNQLGELYSQQDAYTNEIVRVRKTLDMLKTNRRGINRCIDLYESLAAPIRRLPVDVLIRIFREALCFDAAPWHSFGGSDTTPLRLAKVCHLWREIIFQNPLLWTHQAYCLGFSTDVIDVAPIYQESSFPHPLNVLVFSSDIFSDYDSHADTDEEIDRLKERRTEEMKLLMESLDMGRWRRLSWNAEGFHKFESEQTLQYDWSALEVLEICPCTIGLSKGSPFARAPQLRTLRLMASSYRYNASEFSIFCPWEQIEDFWIIDTDAYLVNLCSARSLRRLTLQGQYGHTLTNINPEILAGLEEVCFGDAWVVRFLDETSVLGSMGCLTSLELSKITSDSLVWTPAAATFVVPPCPSLRNLAIRDVFMDKHTLLPLIRALENLKSLVIIEPPILQPLGMSFEDDDDALAVVKNGIITSDVLDVLRGHRLEHLEIVLAEDTSLLGRQSDVLDTIEYLHAISLKSAVIGIRGGVELQPPTLERMKELRKAGLKIWSA